MKILSVEQQLYIQLSTIQLSEKQVVEIIKLINQNPNWKTVSEFAAKHGVASLFYKHFRNQRINEQIPVEVLQFLQKKYFQTLQKNTIIYHEFDKIIDLFKVNNIEVIALKGIALAEIIYGDIALRPMSDIDLLTHESDLSKIMELLKTIGFERLIPRTEFIGTINVENEIGFINKNNILVEIHQSLVSEHHVFEYKIDDFWLNTFEVKIGKNIIPIFTPEYMLFHLCAHLYGHSFDPKFRIGWLFDITNVIAKYSNSINWSLLENLAKQKGMEKPIFETLCFVKNYIPFQNIPLNFEQLITKDYQIFEQNCLHHINLQPEKVHFIIRFSYWKKMKRIRGFSNKIKYIINQLLPSKKFLIYEYQIKRNYQVPYYYFVHLYRLTFKVLRNIFSK